MIKAVVFDMDGTMLDTEKLDMAVTIEIAKKYDFVLTEDILKNIIGITAKDGRLFLEKYLGEKTDQILSEKREAIKEYIEEKGVPTKTGLMELLEFLKQKGYKLAVATSTNRNRAMGYFEKLGIVPYFDSIVCGEDVEQGKPAPDIFQKACQQIDVSPKEAMAIEDSANGIKSATSAGLTTVMIPDLIPPTQELEQLVDKKVESLLEVKELFEKGEYDY